MSRDARRAAGSRRRAARMLPGRVLARAATLEAGARRPGRRRRPARPRSPRCGRGIAWCLGLDRDPARRAVAWQRAAASSRGDGYTIEVGRLRGRARACRCRRTSTGPRRPGRTRPSCTRPGHWMENARLEPDLQRFNARLARAGMRGALLRPARPGRAARRLAPARAARAAAGRLHVARRDGRRDAGAALDVLAARADVDAGPPRPSPARPAAASSRRSPPPSTSASRRPRICCILNTHLGAAARRRLRHRLGRLGRPLQPGAAARRHGQHGPRRSAPPRRCDVTVVHAIDDPPFPIAGARAVVAEAAAQSTRPPAPAAASAWSRCRAATACTPPMRDAAAAALAAALGLPAPAPERARAAARARLRRHARRRARAARPQSHGARRRPAAGRGARRRGRRHEPRARGRRPRARPIGLRRRPRARPRRVAARARLASPSRRCAARCHEPRRAARGRLRPAARARRRARRSTLDAVLLLPERVGRRRAGRAGDARRGRQGRGARTAGRGRGARARGWAVLAPDLRGTGESAASRVRARDGRLAARPRPARERVDDLRACVAVALGALLDRPADRQARASPCTAPARSGWSRCSPRRSTTTSPAPRQRAFVDEPRGAARREPAAHADGVPVPRPRDVRPGRPGAARRAAAGAAPAARTTTRRRSSGGLLDELG